MRITFICTGNTCRSPMAEGIARKRLQEDYPGCDVTVGSAGTGAFVGDPASPNAVAVCREIGVDISGHRSRRISRWIMEQTDLFAVMTQAHADLLRYNGVPEESVAVLGNIPDPYGGSVTTYRLCRDRIDEEVRRLLRRLLCRPSGTTDNTQTDNAQTDNAQTDTQAAEPEALPADEDLPPLTWEEIPPPAATEPSEPPDTPDETEEGDGSHAP